MTNRQLVVVAALPIWITSIVGANQAAPPVDQLQVPPTERVMIGSDRTRCALDGPIVQVPSKLAPDGVRVRISLPVKERYPDGSPIVVHSETDPSTDRVNNCVKEQGFIEIAFSCPAVQQGRDPSSTCPEALADVLAFATGRARTTEGRPIAAYTGSIRVAEGNVGVIGWSAGGNRAIITMARHGDRFPGLRWFASWESPVLSPVDGGWGSIYQLNPYYDTSTGALDFAKLRYSSEMPLWEWLRAGVGWEKYPRGGLFLDVDGNGRFNKDADYAFWVRYAQTSSGATRKAFYTPTVIRTARDRNVFGGDWPAHIATVAEVDAWAADEFPLPYVPNAVKRFPNLAVIVFATEIGHVTVAPDHPHAIAQVNAWLDAKAKWVRLNPDVHYISEVMQRKPTQPVQNSANARPDRKAIGRQVEPEVKNGGPSDDQGMEAAIAELADRTRLNNWKDELAEVLIKRQ